jgi:hypothetical protein
MASPPADLRRLRQAHSWPRGLRLHRLARPRLLRQQPRDSLRGIAQLPGLLVVLGDPLENHDRVALRRAVLEIQDREPADNRIRVRRCEGVKERAVGVHRRRPVPGEQLEREERRAASGRALVLEPTPEQLQLLAVPELADRAIGDRALAEVRAAGRRLELLVPLSPQIRELARRARRRQLFGLGRGLRQLRQWRATGEPGRRIAPTAGRGGRFASARGCAPTSRRRANRRTSPEPRAAGSRPRRGRSRSSTRRS